MVERFSPPARGADTWAAGRAPGLHSLNYSRPEACSGILKQRPHAFSSSPPLEAPVRAAALHIYYAWCAGRLLPDCRLLRGLAFTLYSHADVELMRLWQPCHGLLRVRWRATGRPRLKAFGHRLRALLPGGSQWPWGGGGTQRPIHTTSAHGRDGGGHKDHGGSSSSRGGGSGDSHRPVHATREVGAFLGERSTGGGSDELEYMEVVATYKFNPHGRVFEHVIDTVVPPEPPLLLWPVAWVAQLLAGGRAGQRPQVAVPPMPRTGALNWPR